MSARLLHSFFYIYFSTGYVLAKMMKHDQSAFKIYSYPAIVQALQTKLYKYLSYCLVSALFAANCMLMLYQALLSITFEFLAFVC